MNSHRLKPRDTYYLMPWSRCTDPAASITRPDDQYRSIYLHRYKHRGIRGFGEDNWSDCTYHPVCRRRRSPPGLTRCFAGENAYGHAGIWTRTRCALATLCANRSRTFIQAQLFINVIFTFLHTLIGIAPTAATYTYVPGAIFFFLLNGNHIKPVLKTFYLSLFPGQSFIKYYYIVRL